MRPDTTNSPSRGSIGSAWPAQNRQHDAEVLIVGGGAVGKAAALGLDNLGVRVVLVASEAAAVSESPSADVWDTRVYALSAQTRGLLKSLRVWDALDAARITPVDAMLVEGDDLGHPGRLSFDAYSARVDALAWIVEDNHLNRALDTALRFARSVRRVEGKAVALDAGDDGATLELSSGERLTAALVVGADGGHSWVRARTGFDVDMRSYDQCAVVANFAAEMPHRGLAYQRFTGDQGIVALLPLPGNRLSLVWSAPSPLADVLMNIPFAELAQRVTDAAGRRFGALHPLLPETRRSFPLRLLRARSMTAERVALAGDAAHVVHPLAGQGMNLGFADVDALLRALAERGAHRDCGDARVLARYARARKEQVLWMQAVTDGLARLFETPVGPFGFLRNAGMNLVDRLPGLKRRLILQARGEPH